MKDQQSFPYDPKTAQGVVMAEAYPVLKKNKWFVLVPTERMLGISDKNKAYGGFREEDLDILMRFVVYFVDYRSPYADILDLTDKIKTITKALKIANSSNLYKELSNLDFWVQKVISEYFKFVHNIEYEGWFTMKIALHNAGEFLRRPVAADVSDTNINARRQLLKEYPTMQRQLVDMEYQLFRNEALRDIINRESASDDPGGWAEKYAED